MLVVKQLLQNLWTPNTHVAMALISLRSLTSSFHSQWLPGIRYLPCSPIWHARLHAPCPLYPCPLSHMTKFLWSSLFIHSKYFNGTSESPLLLRSMPDYSIDTLLELTCQMHYMPNALWVKDLPKVPTWQLEWDLNLQPSKRKAPNLPLSPTMKEKQEAETDIISCFPATYFPRSSLVFLSRLV